MDRLRVSHINKDEIMAVADLVFEKMSNVERPHKLDIVLALYDFAGKFDFPAMLRFMKWGKENQMSDMEIASTIIHDLNGMNDKCFSPRTSSY